MGEEPCSTDAEYTVVVLLTACLGLSGCGDDTEVKGAPSAATDSAATVEARPGAVNRVTLTEKAAERLAIKTVAVTESEAPARDACGHGSLRKVVPYAVVLCDVNGGTWVYPMPRPLTYIRERVTVESVEGELAMLSEGPTAQTAAVTDGLAELYGVELGVGQWSSRHSTTERRRGSCYVGSSKPA